MLSAIGITEHPLPGTRRRLVVLINHSPQAQAFDLLLNPGWVLDTVLHGQALLGAQGQLPANDATVLRLLHRR